MQHLNQFNAFLEQYLDEPIENILGKLSQTTVSRDKVVEIGNLAALDMDKAKLMVAFLVFHSRSNTSNGQYVPEQLQYVMCCNRWDYVFMCLKRLIRKS